MIETTVPTVKSERDDEIDLKELFFRLLSKWHWFVLFGFLGVSLGYMYSSHSQRLYEAESIILVKEEAHGLEAENLFEGMEFSGKTSIQNHLGILCSYTINLKTLQNLNWKTSWYKKGVLAEIELYEKAPFSVITQKNDINLSNVKITISPIDEKSYNISVNDKYFDEELMHDITFESIGKYGVPFENEYFNFTIKKTGSITKNDYILVFNDLEQMALNYRKKINVNLVDKNSELIQLKMQGASKGRIVDYLNELSQVYIKIGLEKKNRTSLNTVKFIDSQLYGIVDSLKMTGKKFTKFCSKEKSIDLSYQAELILDKIGELESAQAKINFRINYFQSLLNYMGDSENLGKVAVPSFVGIMDPGINTQVVKLIDLYSKKTTLSHIAREKNPSLIMLNSEIKNVLGSLKENVRNLLSNAEAEAQSLNTRKDSITMKLAALPETEQEMVNIKRRFDLNNDLYTFLLKKRAEAAITTASNTSDVQIVDAARLETVKVVSPKTLMLSAIGFFLGLMIPLIIILFKDFFNDSIKSVEDLEALCTSTVIGKIAHNQYSDELAITKYPRSGLAESFRELRVNLLHILENKKGGKVISIHSMICSEGKTFIAVNLAIILAMNSKKTLLVGCDLRKPRINRIFNTVNNIGLSDYLTRKKPFNSIICTSSVKNLSIANSGPIPPNPGELLDNGMFKEFINEAKKEYDYIILDNAPVALVADGILTSNYSNINLFVLRQDYSHKKQAKYINQLVEKKTIKQISIVLNDTVHKSYSNSYETYGYEYYDEVYLNQKWTKKIFDKFCKN